MAVILINVPMIIVATLNFSVLQLFLISNLLTTAAMTPLLVGIIWRSDKAKVIATETSFVVGVAGAILTVTAYGIGRAWDPSDVAASFSNGAYIAWVGNGYSWDYFFVALMAPIACQGLFIAIAQGLKRVGVEGVGISAIFNKIPGWYYVSGQYADERAAMSPEKVAVELVGEKEVSEIGKSERASEVSAAVEPAPSN